MHPKTLALLTSALLLAVLVGGYFFFKSKAPADTGPLDLSKISTTTNMGGYTITPIPVSNAIPQPDYRKAISYNASVSAEVRTAIETQFADVKSLIAKDKLDFNAWLRLGTLRKMAGDYRGAEEIWIYASKQWEDAIAHGNLGDLYLNFLKEPAKAVASYKAALALKSDNADYKAGLAAAEAAQ